MDIVIDRSQTDYLKLWGWKRLWSIYRRGGQKAKADVSKRMIDLGMKVSVIAATGFSPDKVDQLHGNSH
ncbi:hypothetical protein PAJ34TS1_58010 [Paenibacillus azoreducens]|uniref:Uncharacterized protein n=1 Tax=Paenibacillus azoreducens TaxID=116718 RepID=A0A919YBJ2_9BACL|nr:hypothetical protein J34TS1_21640 [Paenibacillus azoreducens]